ncbi:hypothetical protein [Burkholderia ubonensis]|uniref:hypothetical protein n=1 Tax=Burkholderia ubonensis TaxID=101571 RepID=UPI0007521F2A|nr:hypothetical protein [Burkholderia ubonensis]KVP16947.1 hypothetical protein WJ84_01345 [Burkholderia ubonensis]KVP39929.1 hypothetical protein WJ87_07025 [Burkholderia ubonensis]
MARITIGNNVTRGFVNLVADKRLIVGTGSYQNRDGEKVFKESVTVFLDDKFDGDVPAKGDYVEVSGDLVVQPRKDNADQLNATYNVRFKNQLVKKEAPKKAEAPAGADNDI